MYLNLELIVNVKFQENGASLQIFYGLVRQKVPAIQTCERQLLKRTMGGRN